MANAPNITVARRGLRGKAARTPHLNIRRLKGKHPLMQLVGSTSREGWVECNETQLGNVNAGFHYRAFQVALL